MNLLILLKLVVELASKLVLHLLQLEHLIALGRILTLHSYEVLVLLHTARELTNVSTLAQEHLVDVLALQKLSVLAHALRLKIQLLLRLDTTDLTLSSDTWCLKLLLLVLSLRWVLHALESLSAIVHRIHIHALHLTRAWELLALELARSLLLELAHVLHTPTKVSGLCLLLELLLLEKLLHERLLLRIVLTLIVKLIALHLFINCV